MFGNRIADLNVTIENRYPFVFDFCREFLAEFDVADITVRVSDEELEKEREDNPYSSSDGYLESICVYRQIALQLPRFDAMVFHASVISCDGKGYAFAAHSGTGKSTHTALWQQVFGERVFFVNGDKPILRRREGKWIAYGTPWRGKEKLGGNVSVPLQAICFLERGKENTIAPLESAQMISRLFGQVLMPEEQEMAERFLELLDSLVTSTPTYLLHCNMLPEAAIVAFQGMYVKESGNDCETE